MSEKIIIYKCTSCEIELTILELVWVKSVVYSFNVENRELASNETLESRFETMKEFSRMEFSKLVRNEDWENLKCIKDGTYFPTITYPDIGESIYCKECSEN